MMILGLNYICYLDRNEKGHTVTKEEIMDNTHAVVKFSAQWCSPCKALSPLFDKVASKYPNVKVYLIDIDHNGDVTNDFGVRGIPMIFLIKNKQVVKTLTGMQDEATIEELFK